MRDMAGKPGPGPDTTAEPGITAESRPGAGAEPRPGTAAEPRPGTTARSGGAARPEAGTTARSEPGTTARSEPGITAEAPPAAATPAATPANASAPAPASAAGPLLPPGETDRLGQRLHHAVAGFVDAPRASVEEADRVLEEIAARFTDAVTHRRSTLRTSWAEAGPDSGAPSTDTEQLRLALRDYRELADRLMRL
ncbi:hypothetical protein BSZ07_11840 [Streptomyces sp. M1013]|uniref:hypothetical protein n=1 Tax=Streptomyces sp. M1013 TaxID=549798 RepID=UPI000978DD04|nr:hypothetical protein [Streptomyces sp. M1013]OMI89595.1 hypothetical protein BSZ07_11840 [Streptomyces sp. M1013]